MSEPCPACGKTVTTPWFQKTTTHGSYGLRRCRDCGSAFIIPRPPADELERFYRASSYRVVDAGSGQERLAACLEAERKYPNSTLDAARIVTRCRQLTDGSRFLDVGAGFGFFTREAMRRGFQAMALEPSPNCREIFAEMNGFEPVPTLLTSAFVSEHSGRFDVVLLSQVLEHVAQIDEAVDAIATLLGRGGIAAIAVPHFGSIVSLLQGRNDMFIDPPEHLNFFSASGLLTLFARHGLRCEYSDTVSRFDPARISRRVPVAGEMVSVALLRALALADRVGRGMYLNAYFKRN